MLTHYGPILRHLTQIAIEFLLWLQGTAVRMKQIKDRRRLLGSMEHRHLIQGMALLLFGTLDPCSRNGIQITSGGSEEMHMPMTRSNSQSQKIIQHMFLEHFPI